MVKITDLKNKFWGVSLEGGKRYTQTVANAFHVSMAALEPSPHIEAVASNPHVALMLQSNSAEFLLCTLTYNTLLNQCLQLNFNEGEQVTFFINGPGIVHLSGYLCQNADETEDYGENVELSGSEELSAASTSDDDSEEIPDLKDMDIPDSDEESENDDEDSSPQFPGKRKKKRSVTAEPLAKKQRAAKTKAAVEIAKKKSESDEDYNFIDDEAMEENAFDAGESEESDKDSSEDEEERALTDDKKPTSEKQKKSKEEGSPKKTKSNGPNLSSANVGKKPNATAHVPEIAETPVSGETEKKKKKRKKKKKKNEQAPDNETGAKPVEGQKRQEGDKNETKLQAGRDVKKVLEGGVIMKQMKAGLGAAVKPGQTAHVYYVGRLQTNGKMFDSALGGKGFKFKMGQGEVIKGWDVGMKDMKVGEKRSLVIPPKMAYGSQNLDGIPANSTLSFEVELRSIS